MPTFTTVHAAIKARLIANFNTITLRWPNDRGPLPDDAAPLAYIEVMTDDASIVGFGGGRGGNLMRSNGRIEAHVMAEFENGQEQAFAWAESICAVFRGVRADEINYGAAQVYPGEGRIDKGNMCHVATAIIDFSFDQAA